MKRISLLLSCSLLVFFAASCGSCGSRDTAVPSDGPVACDAGDAAFVAEATLAMLGRRPLSSTETAQGVSAIAALEAEQPGEGRRRFALSLAQQPAFVERWSDLLLDNLAVPRTGVQQLSACYGAPVLVPEDDSSSDELALFVLDNTAIDGTFDTPFVFRDLLEQSLRIDDISPVYRAHLYAMMTNLNGCGNVDAVGQELAFRDEIGHLFEAAYLNRDPVCLACHTTTFSVTDRADREQDRHWPLAGRFEESLFGAASITDPRVSRAVFRVSDFVNGGGGAFPDFDFNLAICFDELGTVTTPTCVQGTVDCGAATAYCFSPIEQPTCDEQGVARCANAPFCSNDVFDTFGPSVCAEDVVSCATAGQAAYCADFNQQPGCLDGVPSCVGFGEGEGEGEGEPPGMFTPWGAEAACGTFASSITTDDPAAIDAHFASVLGKRATVVQLEASLKRGVDALAVRGLVLDDDGRIRNPDDAFAYLVAANIVDNVWRELVGTPLTISTHFPCNAAQRDILQRLTDRFVASHFSLRQLIADVLLHGFMNLRAPIDGCSDDASDDDDYVWPAVFDPWVRDEPIVAMRRNSTADAVHALSARTLTSAAYAALGWPAPPNQAFPESGGNTGEGELEFDQSCFDQFPDCAALLAACAEGTCCLEAEVSCPVNDPDAPLSEAELQAGMGIFHGVSEKGFRGLDFQARLFFESRFGRCARPDGVTSDVVDAIVADARTSGGTVGDVVAGLKERFVGTRTIDNDERALLEAVLGSLSAMASSADVTTLNEGTRTVCGALLASPQFQLRGITSTPASDER